MDELEDGLADHVNRSWDDLVRGAPPMDSLDPVLVPEIRRLHALDRTPQADPAFLTRLEDLMSPQPAPATTLASSPLVVAGRVAPNGHGSAVPPPAPAALLRRSHHWWGAVERMAAAVLVLGLVGGYVALRVGTPIPDEAAATQLYLADRNRQRQTPLDPSTLADLPAGTPVAVVVPPANRGLDRDQVADWSVSADDSTLVSVEYPGDESASRADEITFVVRDGLSGRERSRFHPPAEVPPVVTYPFVQVSADGGRLVARHGPIYLFPDRGPRVERYEWYVFDAATGQLLTTITSDEQGAGYPDQQDGWIDQGGHRLYRLLVVRQGNEPGPWPTRLVVNDLASGAEVGRLDLPGLRGRSWTTDRLVGSRWVVASLVPGAAFSPDGGRLALVHGDGTAATLIDTDTLAVERTIAFPSPVGEPIASESATPGPFDRGPFDNREFSERRIIFASDGNCLYVGGRQATVDDHAQRACGASPWQRVDLATGKVVAEASWVGVGDRVWPTADGRSLYTVGPRTRPDACVWRPGETRVLRRLDPATLATLAEREVASDATIVLFPRIGGGW